LGILRNPQSGFGNFDPLLLLLAAAVARIPDKISPGETVELVLGHGWETGGLHSGRRSRAPTSILKSYNVLVISIDKKKQLEYFYLITFVIP